MEEILKLYTDDYDQNYQLICFDETSKQLRSEIIKSIPAKLGKPERIDYEYKTEGVCNLFIFFEPFRGWRQIEVTNQRTSFMILK